MKITPRDVLENYVHGGGLEEDYQNILLVEDKEVHQEHDKIMKRIFKDKEETANVLNKVLNLEKNILPNQLEQYNREFITKYFEVRNADIVYKLKDKEIYFLLEHQSKVDYSMPYRVLKYKTEILENSIDKAKIKNKAYTLPLIIAIVIYTGKQKWTVNQKINNITERLNTIVEDKPVLLDSFYALLDVNNFTKEELLESNSLLSKIMLIEKANKLDELRENLRSIVIKINKEERLGLTSKEKKEELEGYIAQVISKKIGTIETKELIQELKKGSEENMGMAVDEMIKREKARLRREGRKEGEIVGIGKAKIEVAKKLVEINMPLKQIKEITGITEEELKMYK